MNRTRSTRAPGMRSRGGPKATLPMPLRAWIVTLMIACLLPAADAATISATLDREVIGLGDSATLSVVVEGGTGRDVPSVPVLPGLGMTQPRTQQQFEFVNGRTRIRSQTDFVLTPTRVGEYTIAPITVRVGSQTIQAEPVTLRVVPADDPAASRGDGLDNSVFLELKLPDRDVYVGETFIAEMTLHAQVGRPTQLRRAPRLEAEGFILGPLKQGPQIGNVRRGSTVYSRATLLQPLTAMSTGTLPVRAVDCVVDVALPRGRSITDFFEEGFFGMRENRRFNLATAPHQVTVRPLPTDNVPPSFSGAIGQFEVAMSASPTNLQAGDPITVRIQIGGTGNFDSVQLPAQPAWSQFRVYPPNSSVESEDPFGLQGVKHFEQVVTPESSDVSELPGLEFSYFSPADGTYRTVRTPPVPLTVAPSATPRLATAPGSPSEEERTTAPDLAPLKPHLGSIVSPAAAWGAQPWFLPVSVLPWLLWGGLRTWRMLKLRSDPQNQAGKRRQLQRRIDQEMDRLRNLAENGEFEAFFACLFRLLQELVGWRLGQPPASVTEGVLDADLTRHGIPPETVASLRRLFQACNQARYARTGGFVDLRALQREAQAVRDALSAR